MKALKNIWDNQKGVSLTEVMIAVGIVASSAVAITFYVTQNARTSTRIFKSSQCQSIANNIVSEFKERDRLDSYTTSQLYPNWDPANNEGGNYTNIDGNQFLNLPIVDVDEDPLTIDPINSLYNPVVDGIYSTGNGQTPDPAGDMLPFVQSLVDLPSRVNSWLYIDSAFANLYRYYNSQSPGICNGFLKVYGPGVLDIDDGFWRDFGDRLQDTVSGSLDNLEVEIRIQRMTVEGNKDCLPLAEDTDTDGSLDLGNDRFLYTIPSNVNPGELVGNDSGLVIPGTTLDFGPIAVGGKVVAGNLEGVRIQNSFSLSLDVRLSYTNDQGNEYSCGANNSYSHTIDNVTPRLSDVTAAPDPCIGTEDNNFICINIGEKRSDVEAAASDTFSRGGQNNAGICGGVYEVAGAADYVDLDGNVATKEFVPPIDIHFTLSDADSTPFCRLEYLGRKTAFNIDTEDTGWYHCNFLMQEDDSGDPVPVDWNIGLDPAIINLADEAAFRASYVEKVQDNASRATVNVIPWHAGNDEPMADNNNFLDHFTTNRSLDYQLRLTGLPEGDFRFSVMLVDSARNISNRNGKIFYENRFSVDVTRPHGIQRVTPGGGGTARDNNGNNAVGNFGEVAGQMGIPDSAKANLLWYDGVRRKFGNNFYQCSDTPAVTGTAGVANGNYEVVWTADGPIETFDLSDVRFKWAFSPTKIDPTEYTDALDTSPCQTLALRNGESNGSYGVNERPIRLSYPDVANGGNYPAGYFDDVVGASGGLTIAAGSAGDGEYAAAARACDVCGGGYRFGDEVETWTKSVKPTISTPADRVAHSPKPYINKNGGGGTYAFMERSGVMGFDILDEADVSAASGALNSGIATYNNIHRVGRYSSVEDAANYPNGKYLPYVQICLAYNSAYGANLNASPVSLHVAGDYQTLDPHNTLNNGSEGICYQEAAFLGRAAGSNSCKRTAGSPLGINPGVNMLAIDACQRFDDAVPCDTTFEVRGEAQGNTTSPAYRDDCREVDCGGGEICDKSGAGAGTCANVSEIDWVNSLNRTAVVNGIYDCRDGRTNCSCWQPSVGDNSRCSNNMISASCNAGSSQRITCDDLDNSATGTVNAVGAPQCSLAGIPNNPTVSVPIDFVRDVYDSQTDVSGCNLANPNDHGNSCSGDGNVSRLICNTCNEFPPGNWTCNSYGNDSASVSFSDSSGCELRYNTCQQPTSTRQGSSGTLSCPNLCISPSFNCANGNIPSATEAECLDAYSVGTCAEETVNTVDVWCPVLNTCDDAYGSPAGDDVASCLASNPTAADCAFSPTVAKFCPVWCSDPMEAARPGWLDSTVCSTDNGGATCEVIAGGYPSGVDKFCPTNCPTGYNFGPYDVTAEDTGDQLNAAVALCIADATTTLEDCLPSNGLRQQNGDCGTPGPIINPIGQTCTNTRVFEPVTGTGRPSSCQVGGIPGGNANYPSQSCTVVPLFTFMEDVDASSCDLGRYYYFTDGEPERDILAPGPGCSSGGLCGSGVCNCLVLADVGRCVNREVCTGGPPPVPVDAECHTGPVLGNTEVTSTLSLIPECKDVVGFPAADIGGPQSSCKILPTDGPTTGSNSILATVTSAIGELCTANATEFAYEYSFPAGTGMSSGNQGDCFAMDKSCTVSEVGQANLCVGREWVTATAPTGVTPGLCTAVTYERENKSNGSRCDWRDADKYCLNDSAQTLRCDTGGPNEVYTCVPSLGGGGTCNPLEKLLERNATPQYYFANLGGPPRAGINFTSYPSTAGIDCGPVDPDASTPEVFGVIASSFVAGLNPPTGCVPNEECFLYDEYQCQYRDCSGNGDGGPVSVGGSCSVNYCFQPDSDPPCTCDATTDVFECSNGSPVYVDDNTCGGGPVIDCEPVGSGRAHSSGLECPSLDSRSLYCKKPSAGASTWQSIGTCTNALGCCAFGDSDDPVGLCSGVMLLAPPGLAAGNSCTGSEGFTVLRINNPSSGELFSCDGGGGPSPTLTQRACLAPTCDIAGGENANFYRTLTGGSGALAQCSSFGLNMGDYPLGTGDGYSSAGTCGSAIVGNTINCSAGGNDFSFSCQCQAAGPTCLPPNDWFLTLLSTETNPALVPTYSYRITDLTGISNQTDFDTLFGGAPFSTPVIAATPGCRGYPDSLPGPGVRNIMGTEAYNLDCACNTVPVNGAPTTPVVSCNGDGATMGFSIVTPATDPDGDTITYRAYRNVDCTEILTTDSYIEGGPNTSYGGSPSPSYNRVAFGDLGKSADCIVAGYSGVLDAFINIYAEDGNGGVSASPAKCGCTNLNCSVTPNSPPTAPTISCTGDGTTMGFSVTSGSTDPDGDPITYRAFRLADCEEDFTTDTEVRAGQNASYSPLPLPSDSFNYSQFDLVGDLGTICSGRGLSGDLEHLIHVYAVDDSGTLSSSAGTCSCEGMNCGGPGPVKASGTGCASCPAGSTSYSLMIMGPSPSGQAFCNMTASEEGRSGLSGFWGSWSDNPTGYQFTTVPGAWCSFYNGVGPVWFDRDWEIRDK
ncbi:MAG: hypothetical protein AB8E15_10175 [Bdellovibrionales bacterium]